MKRYLIPLGLAGCAVLGAGALYLAGDRSARSAVPPGPSIFLMGVQGAPGDGNQALSRAIEVILTTAKVPLVEQLGPCTVAVSAEVSILRQDTAEQVNIVWIVHDENGRALGEVAQSSTIAAGEFDGAWGTEASLAARGARDGIISIMRRPRPGCA